MMFLGKMTFILIALLGLPALAEEGSWKAIAPGGDTKCAFGSPYQFFVREGSKDNALVYFQGGGACWSSQNCDLKNRPSFDPFVNEMDNPANHPSGIFDLDNPNNPTRDYTMVFVSYCSGDTHLGDVAQNYSIRDETGGYDTAIHIEHRGYVNASAALAWLDQNYQPNNIVIAGGSAGSIAAPFFASIIADNNPDAEIAVFSDASGGYRTPAIDNLLTNWGAKGVAKKAAAYTDDEAEVLTFEDLAINTAKRHPKIRFAQYNAAYDESETFFLTLLGVTTPLLDAIKANERDLHAGIPHFASFIDHGKKHMILEYDRLYENSVNGHSVLNFFTDFVAGNEPEDVTCAPCKD